MTRPQQLASTLDGAVEKLMETCQSYYRQCMTYRNDAITGQTGLSCPVVYPVPESGKLGVLFPHWFSEFRGQLDTLLSLLVELTPRILEEVKVRHLTLACKERERLQQDHEHTMSALSKEKVSTRAL